MSLKLCITQFNFVVGDLKGNADRIVQAAREAYGRGVRLVLTPELAICGYAAEDLFLRPTFIEACDAALASVAERLADLPGLYVIVGHPTGGGSRERSIATSQRANVASVLCGGQVVARYAKQRLPNYQVFDEQRYFSPGDEPCVIDVHGVPVGILICEDAWFEEPVAAAKAAGAQVLAVLNASPFHAGKAGERESRMARRAQSAGLPLVYAHLVGGQDEVVFDGASFAVDAAGGVCGRAPAFADLAWDLELAPVAQGWSPQGRIAERLDADAELWHALVMGVRDYLGKNGFPGAIIGLSGGIDSALVLAVAVDALGPQRVRAVMMPSPYTADMSWIDAAEMARRLRVRYDEISIVPEFEAFKASLARDFAGRAEDTTEENLQARIRGVLLMALSNKFGSIVLTTGNKSEMATGYCTLYGDMAGGFAVIKDVFKTTVFRLARWRNANDPFGQGLAPIPERIITRPPSAELRPGQVDQDSLPAYEVLDAVLQRYMEEDQSVEEVVAQGFERSMVERIARLLRINEYKRRQAPVGIRVSHRSFGKDWRYPITSHYRA